MKSFVCMYVWSKTYETSFADNETFHFYLQEIMTFPLKKISCYKVVTIEEEL